MGGRIAKTGLSPVKNCASGSLFGGGGADPPVFQQCPAPNLGLSILSCAAGKSLPNATFKPAVSCSVAKLLRRFCGTPCARFCRARRAADTRAATQVPELSCPHHLCYVIIGVCFARYTNHIQGAVWGRGVAMGGSQRGGEWPICQFLRTELFAKGQYGSAR